MSDDPNVILAAADRAVDRQRAAHSPTCAEIMKDFSFADADSLLRYSVATMQNISSDEATVIEKPDGPPSRCGEWAVVRLREVVPYWACAC